MAGIDAVSFDALAAMLSLGENDAQMARRRIVGDMFAVQQPGGFGFVQLQHS
jgi:hypothetical protein